jgi:hypothetical protein
MGIVPFDPKHCAGAIAHPTQAHYQDLFDNPLQFADLWVETYTAMNGNDVIAIGGLVPSDGGKGGWVLFTDKVTPGRFLKIHKALERYLRSSDAIYAHVDPESKVSVRWAQVLGLEVTGIDVFPDGREMMRVEANV